MNIDLLCTEPVVICFSVRFSEILNSRLAPQRLNQTLIQFEPLVQAWIGFLWGVFYGLLESLGLIFRKLYGFNSGESGLVFFSIWFVSH